LIQFKTHDLGAGTFLPPPRNLRTLHLNSQELPTAYGSCHFLAATDTTSTLKETMQISRVSLDEIHESGIPALVYSEPAHLSSL